MFHRLNAREHEWANHLGLAESFALSICKTHSPSRQSIRILIPRQQHLKEIKQSRRGDVWGDLRDELVTRPFLTSHPKARCNN